MLEMPAPGVRLPDHLHDFYQLPRRLQGTDTKLLYLGVPVGGNRAWWDLAGPDKGKQGVALETNVNGLFQVPSETKLTRGPYMAGADFERLDVKEREINFAVSVGALPTDRVIRDSAFRYRMVEERWWSSWSKTEDGYFCLWTRTHGWRYLRVRLLESKTQLDADPVAFDNNVLTHPITAVALDPYWRKRQVVRSWTNPDSTSTPWEVIAEWLIDQIIPGLHVGEAYLPAPNWGDEPVYPKFVVSTPGRVWLQDGITDRMVELPMLTPADGGS